MNVSLLNVERHPHEFQRIYLPPKHLLDKKIALRSTVKLIFSDNESALCRVFLMDHEHTDFYKMSTAVKTCGGTLDWIQTGKGITVTNVEPLPTVRLASNVDCKLICKDIGTVIKLRSDEKIEEILQSILRGLTFLPGYFVHLEDHLVAKLYGVSGAIIQSVNGSSVCSNKCVFEIDSSTSIHVQSIVTKRRHEYIQNSAKRDPAVIGGLRGQMNECSKIFNSRSKRRKGILLFGPSGSGKTSCLRQVCRNENAHLITVNANEFFGSREGESEGRVRSIFEDAKLHAEEGLTVLYIQYIELLNDSSADRNTSHSLNRSLLQLVSILDELSASSENNDLLVVASAHDILHVHQSLRRPGRLDCEIHFGVPKFSQRLEIISYLLPLGQQHADWLAEMTPGYLPADLGLLVSHAKMETLHRGAFEMEFQDCSKALKLVAPSGFKGGLGHVSISSDDDSPDLNSIRGLESVKLQLRRSIQWPLQHPEAFARLGIKCPRGILLYGPPGCGKTSLARAFSKDGAEGGKNVSFLSVSGASIYSPFVGDSEKNIVEVFRKARLGAPCVLFIDEIDTLVSKRGSKSRGDVQERILSTLLNEMDGLENLIQPLSSDEKEPTHLDNENQIMSRVSTKNRVYDAADVIVIGATNRPEVLDAALVRPGRFDVALYVPLPDSNGRLDILRHKTSKIPLAPDVDLKELAAKSEYLSGADLEALCREAALEAVTSHGLDDFKHVHMQDFRKALESMRPSISNDMLKKYEELNKELHFHQRGSSVG